MDKYYIAYGSNMNLEQMAFRCSSSKVVGTAILENYRLVFRGKRGNSHATIEPAKNQVVPVVIWTIPPWDEESLDVYEGFPSYYFKQNMEVNLKGKKIDAMVYIMTKGKPLGLPSSYYYGIIKDGYESANLDCNILNEAVEYTFKNM